MKNGSDGKTNYFFCLVILESTEVKEVKYCTDSAAKEAADFSKRQAMLWLPC